MQIKRQTLVTTVMDIRWRIDPGDLLRLLVPGVIVLLINALPRFDLTPFINTLQDLVVPSSRWLYADGADPVSDQLWSQLLIGILFVSAFTYFIYQLYYTFRRAVVPQAVDEEEKRYERWLKTKWFYRSKNIWSANWLFAAILVTSIVELLLIYTHMDEVNTYFDGAFYQFWTHTTFLLRLIGIALALYLALRTFFNDFLKGILFFLQRFLSYFYASILAIVILGVVLANMDQMDSLFIDLIKDKRSFFVFSVILFPASLIIIWFTPYYLQFTDALFMNQDEERDRSMRYLLGDQPTFKSKLKAFGWLFLHKRLLLPLPEQEAAGARGVSFDLRTGEEIVPPTTPEFHMTRLILGISYICILANICFRIFWANDAGDFPWHTLLTVLVPLAAFGYLWAARRTLPSESKYAPQHALSDTEPAADHKPSLYQRFFLALGNLIARLPLAQRIHHRLHYRGSLSGRPRALVRAKWPLTILTLVTIGFTILFFATLFLIHPGGSWRPAFFTFLCLVVLSIFVFIGITFYRPFFKRYAFEDHVPTDGFMDALDYTTTSLILAFIPLIALGALIFFLAGLFNAAFLSSPLLQSINPLNIYLLLINGLIALLLLLDRSLLLVRYIREYERNLSGKSYVAPKYRIWAVVVIAILFAQFFYGNSYNEIQYHSAGESSAAQDQSMSLADYTQQFVNSLEERKGQKAPIILIAADGGGLKAAYWTMLNLQKLDEELDLFDNHVFLSSGASGGAIGLGMYTFMKALQLPDAAIEERIQTIGATNFLSGDFTGLLTRFPLRYWPDQLGFLEAHQLDDRMDAMAEAYFDICTPADSPFTFEQLRRQPFAQIWKSVDYQLPLYVLNTSRSEDGLRGIVHPLQEDRLLTSDVVDLTSNLEGEFISYPEALFLTNRFPVFSPAGKIQGKGNFIDAGAVENSGLGTIYQFLEVMRARTRSGHPDSLAFARFFEHPVYILSIRNAKSRFVRDQFYDLLDQNNRSFHVSDLNANVNAALNSGLVGAPVSWDDRLVRPEVQPAKLYDRFFRIDLPFRLEKHDPHYILQGQITSKEIGRRVDAINERIYRQAGCDGPCPLVMPPLGRLLAQPVREYMQQMVNFPDNEAVYDSLRMAGVAPATLGQAADDQ